MEEKDFMENTEDIVNETDKVAENTTNEQFVEESEATAADIADNLAEELASLKDTHLRLVAEYDNYRKRTVKEKADLIKNGGEKVLSGLLPIVDDFERALSIEPADEVSKAVVEGVNLIYNKLLSFLNQQGVKAIEATGKEFDDDLFDAIATIPAPDESLKGKVVDCVQKGYTLNEKVLRHAKVVVGE